MFKLTKLELRTTSKIPAGHTYLGERLVLLDRETNMISLNANLGNVAVGNEMGIGGMKTSPVASILEITPTSVTFKTQTSTYKLEEVADEKNPEEAQKEE